MNLKHDSLNHEKNQLIGKRIIIEDVEWRISHQKTQSSQSNTLSTIAK